MLYLKGGPKPKVKIEPNNSSETEPLVGGETIFYSYMNRLLRLKGGALFHIHGDRCMLHEVRNVTKCDRAECCVKPSPSVQLPRCRWIFGVKLMPQQSTSTKVDVKVWTEQHKAKVGLDISTY